MARNNGPRGEYEKHDSARCVWCGEVFETNHGNAQTCGQRCRSNLARFRKLTGLEPDELPGKRTAQTMYLDLIGKLMAAERRRRMTVALIEQAPWYSRDEVAREVDQAERERRRSG